MLLIFWLRRMIVGSAWAKTGVFESLACHLFKLNIS